MKAKAGLQMYRVKLHVVLGSVFILLIGFSPIAWSESKPSDSHAVGVAPESASNGHAVVGDGAADRAQYQNLLEFFKSKPSGFSEHVVLLGKDKPEEKQIAADQMKGFQKWAETFKSYREGLASCALHSDTSAELLGKFLDKFVAEINHVSSDKAPDWKVSEKKVLAYIVEIERFLDLKKKKYSEAEAKEFSPADDALKAQLAKTAEAMFGAYHGASFDIAAEIKKEEAAAEQAKVNQTLKPAPLANSSSSIDIASLLQKAKSAVQQLAGNSAQAQVNSDNIKGIQEEMEKAVQAQNLRSGNACKIAAAVDKKDEKKDDKKDNKDANKDKNDDKNKVGDTQKKDDKPTADPKIESGPLQGNKGNGGTPPPGGTPSPGNQPTVAPTGGLGETGTGNPGTGNPGTGNTGTGNPGTTGDPTQQTGTGTFDPNQGQGNLGNQFDPTGLLQGLSDDFNRRLNDLTNGFNGLFRGLQNGIDDLARQQNQAQNDRGDDGALAAALKALGDKNNEQPVQPPPPPAPPQIAPPPSGESQQPQQQIPPQQPQDQPPPPPFNPMSMMPPPSPSAAAPFYPQERSRFDDDRYIPPPVVPVEPFDPMKQLYQMMAMRAIMQPQGGAVPPGVANVNRIAQLGPRPVTLVRPGALPMAGFATKAGAPGRLVVPGARSNTLPSRLQSARR